MRSLLVISLATFLGACAVGAAPEPDADKTIAIQEAVFRYQFEHNASSQQRSADYYCLGLKDRKNPSEELMKRFAGHSPPVVAVSECRKDIHTGVSRGPVVGSGLIFTVADIKWVNASEVEVSGGYYEGGLSSSGNVYRVKCIDGIWTVVEDKMEWIS